MGRDGTRPEIIEDIMRTEIDAVATRHRDGKAICDQIGRFAPAFGMIGTLLGLVMMLGNMTDPSAIGAGMAVALPGKAEEVANNIRRSHRPQATRRCLATCQIRRASTISRRSILWRMT